MPKRHHEHYEEGKSLARVVLTHTVILLLFVLGSWLVGKAMGLLTEPRCIEKTETIISVKGATGTPDSEFQVHQVTERCK